MFFGCQRSQEEKAQELIKEFIVENANDPESYEPIEILNIKSSTGLNAVGDKEKQFEVLHKYRINNGFGAKILNSDVFIIDSSFTKVLYFESLIENIERKKKAP